MICDLKKFRALPYGPIGPRTYKIQGSLYKGSGTRRNSELSSVHRSWDLKKFQDGILGKYEEIRGNI